MADVDPLDAAVSELVARLGALPEGAVVALTLFGHGERTVAVRSVAGAASVVSAAEHRPGAVLSFPADAAIAIARDPRTVATLLDEGRLHRRGDQTLAAAAVTALGSARST